ncbi:MAG: ABC transporter ATP-binding protein [Candidatus Aureabacteria bacterium]|nr:ABC transporter ATP-binding protein [Candidatus Auribacterota bacterium]
MKSIIKTEGLTKKYGKMVAIKNLNLDVPHGSIFAFLGPNGAGKTTTIKTFMNILSPSSGKAFIMGKDSRHLGPLELSRIGYISENQKLPEWMTIERFLDYCRPLYPLWDKEFCQSLLKQFEIPLKKKMKTLSRGMKVKASLVSSLAYRPELLVLDEPFTGLDPLVREELINGMLEVTEGQKQTIFISSHDIDEVERLADWVGIIDKGILRLIEETDSLRRRFKNVELSLNEEYKDAKPLESWYLFQKEGRSIRFIESQFRERESEEKIKTCFPGCQNLVLSGLSLREIFLVFAKQFRIQNL